MKLPVGFCTTNKYAVKRFLSKRWLIMNLVYAKGSFGKICRILHQKCIMGRPPIFHFATSNVPILSYRGDNLLQVNSTTETFLHIYSLEQNC